ALGWRREDDRVARALVWLSDSLTLHGHTWSVPTLAEVLRACVAQCPPDDALRQASEAALRKRQWEDGSFGDDLATARALMALLDLVEQPKGNAAQDACVQAQRAARALIARVGLLARAHLGAAPSCSDEGLPGFGLSPRLVDPCAGIRDIHESLLRFRTLSP
ncbi:MAG: hypothetical protein KC457_31770, partial [Myxococcales bacterium]|nr:hypothetical protein [Myxococcales bacterium]